MSLYYEEFPAEDGDAPQLPPLLTAVPVPEGQDVAAKALAAVATAEVGTVLYSEATKVADFAVILGPEVPLRQAGQMLYALMIGVGDAIGALAPPEVVVSYQLPGYILLNRGRAGRVWITADPSTGREDVPGWLVVGATIDLSVRTGSEDVWRDAGGLEYTSLAEEGGSFISRTRLVESICRHFMAWVNRWEDDGFRPLHDLWIQRLQEGGEMALADSTMADWIGLDEDGAALIKIDGRPVGLTPTEFESVCGPAELHSLKAGA
jgi:BirA family biotin operon repressor/biotin-[acetyl-CoA-carboxylase] ligase